MLKIFIPLILISVHFLSYAQPKSVRERLINVVDYTDVKITSDSLSQWVEWVKIGESLEAEVQVRNDAWKKFLLSFYRHQKTIPDASVNEQSLVAWSQFLTFPFLTGRILDFKSIGRDEIYTSEIISQAGSGSKHILLIPPLGFNSNIFEVFKNSYKDEYTFHEVSFPQGNNVWRYPEKANYSHAKWLGKIEDAVSSYLHTLGDKEMIVLALGTGTYTAIKLTEKFLNIKGIVSLNGQYKSDLVNERDGHDADTLFRKSASNRAFPTPLLIQFSPGVLARNYAFTQNSIKNQEYLGQITSENVNTLLRYNQEFKAQDITDILIDSKSPILSIVSIHNDQSSQASDRTVTRLWQEIDTMHPDLPLSIVKIPESQNLAFIDQPDLFGYYFDKFANAPTEEVNQIPTDNKVTVELPSPLVSTCQVIESCKITLEYHQPALNGRKVFGQLIPYGEVWRAGANDATRLEVSRDVLINGTHFLKAGKYSLFFIPTNDYWEVVINSIPDQWGAFNYKEEFDVLRFKVKPSMTDQPIEFLDYHLTRTKPDVANITLSWANTLVSFNITQFFSLPQPPTSLISSPWQELLTDRSGDGANPDLTDGKSLSFFQRNDSLWFKFDLYQYKNKKAFALNILIDSDFDQETGSAWFGQNTSFTFDKALTLWMQKSGNGFQGIHGIMYPDDFTTGNQNLSYMNNMTYYLDVEKRIYIVGVSVKDLQLTSEKIRVIGAVGEFQTWNDDIGDNTSASIRIKK